MYLFKYVSNPDFILEDGYIRATQLSALNDPFEAIYDENRLNELSSYFEGTETGEELTSYINKNKEKIGIISFSESKDNLLMWSHYANNHKGALIGIIRQTIHKEQIFENLFVPDYNTLLGCENFFDGRYMPVKYRKQLLYKIDNFDRDYSNIAGEGADRILYEIFQQKSDEWIYEKEHRIILKLEQADKVILDNSKGTYSNIDWMNKLKKRKYCTSNRKSKLISIYLNKINDEVDRQVTGNMLADLAKNNPNNIYLFKLNTSSICSISYGHKTNEENIYNYEYPNRTGRFDIFTTEIDKNNDIIKFSEVAK